MMSNTEEVAARRRIRGVQFERPCGDLVISRALPPERS
jgi:hypothetical protein